MAELSYKGRVHRVGGVGGGGLDFYFQIGAFGPAWRRAVFGQEKGFGFKDTGFIDGEVNGVGGLWMVVGRFTHRKIMPVSG